MQNKHKENNENMDKSLDYYENSFISMGNSNGRDDQHSAQSSDVTREVIIKLQNISKAYNVGTKPVHALNNVSLSIDSGEFVAITGSSGSGKSTLLHIIGCLDKPDSGSIRINGLDVINLNDSELSRLRQEFIGFVFQSFYLQPFLHLDENVSIPAMFTNKKKNRISQNVREVLESTGLTDRTKHYPRELSGGQIQRASIARALVNNPRLILADEPTGNLDSSNGDSIIDLFEEIRTKFGTTIVIVTHDRSIAQRADRVIELKDGVIT